MADDLLSQGEIDALMAGLNTEMRQASEGSEAELAPQGPREKKIKRYDFKRPDRFSKDQLRMIEMMHESFARHFGAALSTYIRTIAEVKTVSVKQSTYGEYVSSLANPTAISVFSLDPLKGNSMLDFSPDIMFTLIDRILGGPGSPMAKQRELTDIEQVIVGKVAIKALDNLRDAWMRVIMISPEIRAKETNPQFVQLVAPSEMVLVIRFSIAIKEQQGEMTICLPYIVLEPVISKLSTRTWFTSGMRNNDEEIQKNIKHSLNQTKVPVIVKVGNSTLNTRELLQLKVGDVVKLETSVHDDLEVFVENRRMFGGRPGIHAKKKAVMVTKVFDEAEELAAL